MVPAAVGVVCVEREWCGSACSSGLSSVQPGCTVSLWNCPATPVCCPLPAVSQLAAWVEREGEGQGSKLRTEADELPAVSGPSEM